MYAFRCVVDFGLAVLFIRSNRRVTSVRLRDSATFPLLVCWREPQSDDFRNPCPALGPVGPHSATKRAVCWSVRESERLYADI